MKYKIFTPKGFITFNADDDACAKVIGEILACDLSELRNEKGQVVVEAKSWPTNFDSKETRACIIKKYDSLIRSIDSINANCNPVCVESMKRYAKHTIKEQFNKIASNIISIIFEESDNTQKKTPDQDKLFFMFTPLGCITFSAKNDIYARVVGGLILPERSIIKNRNKDIILNMNEAPSDDEIYECFANDFSSITDSLKTLHCAKNVPTLNAICDAAKDVADSIIELIEEDDDLLVCDCCGEEIGDEDLFFGIEDHVFCADCVKVVDRSVGTSCINEEDKDSKTGLINEADYVVVDGRLYRVPDDDDDEED